LDETCSGLCLMTDFVVSGVEPEGSATRYLIRPFAFCLSSFFVLSGSGSNPLSDPGVPFCTYCHGKHSAMLWRGAEPTQKLLDQHICPPPVVSCHAAAAVRATAMAIQIQNLPYCLHHSGNSMHHLQHTNSPHFTFTVLRMIGRVNSDCFPVQQ